MMTIVVYVIWLFVCSQLDGTRNNIQAMYAAISPSPRGDSLRGQHPLKLISNANPAYLVSLFESETKVDKLEALVVGAPEDVAWLKVSMDITFSMQEGESL